MKKIINEFKGIVWPNKQTVKQEFFTVIIFSILGMFFISLINSMMTGLFTLF